jgi:hypothetical protein
MGLAKGILVKDMTAGTQRQRRISSADSSPKGYAGRVKIVISSTNDGDS